jgi:hypothetical protein
VEGKVGKPLTCLVYAKEGHIGKVFGDQLFLEVDFEDVKRWSKNPRVFVVLEYSTRRMSYLSYSYWRIHFQDGKVFQAVVTNLD